MYLNIRLKDDLITVYRYLDIEKISDSGDF